MDTNCFKNPLFSCSQGIPSGVKIGGVLDNAVTVSNMDHTAMKQEWTSRPTP